MIETRSKETSYHVKRVAEISYMLARALGLPDEVATDLRDSSPMHDICKIGIPESILNKPGKLTLLEYEVVKTHTTIGYHILNKSHQRLMKSAAIVALEHHEYWNGKGYPRGLAGEEINIYGRITCIADVFDAISRRRSYKEPWDTDRLIDYIKANRRVMFDPALVDLFMDRLDTIFDIGGKYVDN